MTSHCNMFNICFKFHKCVTVLESLYEIQEFMTSFDKTFSNGKMSHVTIVDLIELIKLGI